MSRSLGNPEYSKSGAKKSAVAKGMILFISVLSLIWILAATSLLKNAWGAARSLVVAVPTPVFYDVEPFWSLERLPALPLITSTERLRAVQRDDVLSDPLNRISQAFKVSPILNKRVSFWFDIYTLYGRYEHVIHHTRYPWIVYKVIDGRELIQSGSGPLWMRRQKLERLVRSERLKLRRDLKALAKKKSFRRLTSSQRQLYKKLKYVGGSRRSVFRYAANNLRSQLGQKDFFRAGLKRSSKYLPYMEHKFSESGLPKELTRLPFVESSFNEKAQSKVGASGVWQIMPRVGRAYMKVNNYIDERNSPMKATQVAIKLFKQNYRSLGTWPLAVTAYNNGIGNIRKAIRRVKSKDLGEIITHYHRGSFKFASSNFYASFLAALHAEKYQEVLFQPIAKDPYIDFKEIQLASKMRIKSLIAKSGISAKQFLHFNRDLKIAIRKNLTLPKGFKIHLPLENAIELKKKVTASRDNERTKA